MTEFAKVPLNTSLQERYINGSVLSHTHFDNFIGSEMIFPLYESVSGLCKHLFDADYADARPLSGMNATTTVLLTTLNIGDKVAVLSPSGGGHDSFTTIVNRLGFQVFDVPFDFSSMQPDIYRLNKLIREKNIKAVLFAPSDIIIPPPINEIELNHAFIIYDATQTLGLIASGHVPNPLHQSDRIVLVGGTHKTLPGPTSGLILTNARDIFNKIDFQGGIYVRNPQPHQIASLILTLIEFSVIGRSYMSQTIKNANKLAKELYERDFEVLKSDKIPTNQWTETHQIFIHASQEKSKVIERNAIKYGVTLNRKEKAIFKHSGIRLGLQEVTRIGWGEKEMIDIANIINLLKDNHLSDKDIIYLMESLPDKNVNYYTYKPTQTF